MWFYSADDNKDVNYEISKMFLLNNYKGKKIGEKAAKKIFEKDY